MLLPASFTLAKEEPSVTIEDQFLTDDNMVIVVEVVAVNQGWIVIHADQDGFRNLF
jgi:hypothetical protein